MNHNPCYYPALALETSFLKSSQAHKPNLLKVSSLFKTKPLSAFSFQNFQNHGKLRIYFKVFKITHTTMGFHNKSFSAESQSCKNSEFKEYLKPFSKHFKMKLVNRHSESTSNITFHKPHNNSAKPTSIIIRFSESTPTSKRKTIAQTRHRILSALTRDQQSKSRQPKPRFHATFATVSTILIATYNNRNSIGFQIETLTEPKKKRRRSVNRFSGSPAATLSDSDDNFRSRQLKPTRSDYGILGIQKGQEPQIKPLPAKRSPAAERFSGDHTQQTPNHSSSGAAAHSASSSGGPEQQKRYGALGVFGKQRRPTSAAVNGSGDSTDLRRSQRQSSPRQLGAAVVAASDSDRSSSGVAVAYPLPPVASSLCLLGLLRRWRSRFNYICIETTVRKTRGPTQCLKIHVRQLEDKEEITLDIEGEAIGPTDEDVNNLSKFLSTAKFNIPIQGKKMKMSAQNKKNRAQQKFVHRKEPINFARIYVQDWYNF
ncbi:hypothetical protein Ahy_B08g090851 [Arachis hypogaea]|uniref:Uncharacterized protein n=1 Tax=Arachis hypogaea TaxID=3818 RepID=A0A444Y0R2_ARAHY|nr:hypothetical protein Ahy_B08g090851 [Arachis hypogaea]